MKERFQHPASLLIGAACLAALAACGKARQPGIGSAEAPNSVMVAERYLTPRDETDNVDSVAVWHSESHGDWLIATAKTTHVLLVYDAASGAPRRTVGRPGSDLGEFQRPNGIAVVGDLAFVVERDNARIQVLRLPAFEPLGSFGEGLKRPYGIFAIALNDGAYDVFVTDNYEQPDGSIPPDEELGERVHRYRVAVGEGGVQSEIVRAFGATTGPGVLKKVESIFGDPEHDRLLVADELYEQRNVKIYELEGKFTGRTMGQGIFEYEPEGIALYRCPAGEGYWFIVDQDEVHNTFHVFDRRSLEALGSFAGEVTLNTDGIWLTQRRMPGFEGGALFAVHDDGSIAAFDLEAVLGAMKLRSCRLD